MGDPLEGLDGVGWEAMPSDDGDSRWVPSALRTLATDDRAARRRALAELDARLVQQGAVFVDAGAAAVPFLVALACEPATPDPGPVLVVAADLALGGHWNHVRGGWRGSALTRAAGDPPARRALVERVPSILALLDGRDAALRAAACLALAFVPERASEIVPRLVAKLAKERGAPVRFGATLALGLLGREDPLTVEAALARALGAKAELERTAAALAWIASQPQPFERELVLDLAIAALAARDDEKLLWLRGRLGALASDVIAGGLARDGSAASADAVAARVAETDAETGVAAVLLDAAFAGSPRPRSLRTWAELDARQRETVARIARSQRALPTGALRRHGVFDMPRDLARFAGLAARGPLDEEIEGRPIWAHLRDARDDDAARGALLEQLAGWTDAALVALCRDAAAGRYRLDSSWPPSKRGDRAGALAEVLAEILARASAAALRELAEEVAAGPRHAARPSVLAEWTEPAVVLGALTARTDVQVTDEALRVLHDTAAADPVHARIVDRARARFPRIAAPG